MGNKVIRCALEDNKAIFESECPVKEGRLKAARKCQSCSAFRTSKLHLPPQLEKQVVFEIIPRRKRWTMANNTLEESWLIFLNASATGEKVKTFLGNRIHHYFPNYLEPRRDLENEPKLLKGIHEELFSYLRSSNPLRFVQRHFRGKDLERGLEYLGRLCDSWECFEQLPGYILTALSLDVVSLSKDGYWDHVFSCKQCGKFYRLKTRRKHPYCSDGCRYRWHNVVRNRTGEHKRYMREWRTITPSS